MAPPTDLIQQKKALRQALRLARKNLSPEARRAAEAAVRRQLLPLLKKGRRIGVYLAVGSELNLSQLIDTAQARGCPLYAPYIDPKSRRLWFTPLRAQASAERRAPFGIPQYEGKKVRISALDVVLLPLVGIDAHGYRLGQGGGFYDTSLAACATTKRPKLIGVGFDVQRCEQVPIEPWDQPLDAYVSESGWLHF
ncbi:MAG: 5-formyltetrahydrofolate cyclo-ligase [Neisseriaceae bacterium]|nr:5-formyltetrahydrofolate cyclo-ligase [Neisseriaceae bacterium]MBP6862861.1 5-formyltetrahydrofolate cyclo-ligase [Neisseriaceae bacterium]